MPFESFHRAAEEVKTRPGKGLSLNELLTYVVRTTKGVRRVEIVIGNKLMSDGSLKTGNVVDILFDRSDGLARIVKKGNNEEGFKIRKRGKDIHGHIGFKWASCMPFCSSVKRMDAEIVEEELYFEFPKDLFKHLKEGGEDSE